MLQLVPNFQQNLWSQYSTEHNRTGSMIVLRCSINPKLGYSVVPTSQGGIGTARDLPRGWYYATARSFTVVSDFGLPYFYDFTILS